MRLKGASEVFAVLIIVSLTVVVFAIAYMIMTSSIYLTSGPAFYFEAAASGTPQGYAAAITIRVKNVGNTPIYVGYLYVVPSSSSSPPQISWYQSSDPSVYVVSANTPGSQCGSKILYPGQYIEASIQIVGSGWQKGTQVNLIFVACSPDGNPISQTTRVML
ncbi:MAG TPA: hypothetical protein VNL13_05780 [Sulfolobales archaeon]|nr:hypothetical protein [Sulfolobales archaeon]